MEVMEQLYFDRNQAYCQLLKHVNEGHARKEGSEK